jgi:hypothetical protein
LFSEKHLPPGLCRRESGVERRLADTGWNANRRARRSSAAPVGPAQRGLFAGTGGPMSIISAAGEQRRTSPVRCRTWLGGGSYDFAASILATASVSCG